MFLLFKLLNFKNLKNLKKFRKMGMHMYDDTKCKILIEEANGTPLNKICEKKKTINRLT